MIEKRLMSDPKTRNAKEEAKVSRDIEIRIDNEKCTLETWCTKIHPRKILRGSCCLHAPSFVNYSSLIAALSVDKIPILTLFSQPADDGEGTYNSLATCHKPVLPPTLVFMTRDASTLLRCFVFFMQERTDVAKMGCQFIYIISLRSLQTWDVLRKYERDTQMHNLNG